MTQEWTGFNAVLANRGINPQQTKLYRHTVHPTHGNEAFDRWQEGHDQFLSFATVQNASVNIYGPKVQWCAHFLAEKNVDVVKNAARFLGVTKVLGETAAFSEASPVEGYIGTETHAEPSGVQRSATPLAWEPWDQWDDLSDNLLIDWGKGPRAKAQWAHSAEKLILLSFANEETTSASPEDAQSAVYENRILRLHLIYERSGCAARLAKELKKLCCEGCGLDGVAAFGNTLAKRCMEAHHLTPVAHMPDQGRLVNPVDDFAILCATCHRLIHGLPRPDDLSAIRALWPAQGLT